MVGYQEFNKAYRQQLERRDEMETELHARLARVFARQQRVVKRRLRTIRKSLITDVPLTAATAPRPKPPEPTPSLRASEVFMDEFDDVLEEEMEPDFERWSELIGVALVGAKVFGSRKTRLNPYTRQQVSQQVRRLRYVTDATTVAVEQVLSTSYQEGLLFDETAARVTKVFDRLSGRTAALVARVEAVALLGGAVTAAARLAQVPVQRMWITMEDERVRPAHEDAHGQIRGLDEPFLIGDSLLDYPGDPSGPIDMTANCRCELAMIPVGFDPDDFVDPADFEDSDEFNTRARVLLATVFGFDEDEHPRDEAGKFTSGGGLFLTRVGPDNPVETADLEITKAALHKAAIYDPDKPYRDWEDWGQYANVETDPETGEPIEPEGSWEPGSVEALSQAVTDWQSDFQTSRDIQVAADAILGFRHDDGLSDPFDLSSAAHAREILTAMAGAGPEGAASAHALIGDDFDLGGGTVRASLYGGAELVRGLDDPDEELLGAFRAAHESGGTVAWSMTSFVIGGDEGADRIPNETNAGMEEPSYTDPDTGEQVSQESNDRAAEVALAYTNNERSGVQGENPVLIRTSGTGLSLDGGYEALVGGQFTVDEIRAATPDELNRWNHDRDVTIVQLRQIENVRLPEGIAAAAGNAQQHALIQWRDGTNRRDVLTAAFNPDQDRDEHGRWTGDGTGDKVLDLLGVEHDTPVDVMFTKSASQAKQAVSAALGAKMKSSTEDLTAATYRTSILGNDLMYVARGADGKLWTVKAETIDGLNAGDLVSGDITTHGVALTDAVRGDQPGAEALVREMAASALVEVWSVTTNDSDPIALAIQEVAREHFGIDDAAGWEFADEEVLNRSLDDQIAERVAADGDVYRDFLQTQYDQTQERLADAGIEEIDLVRGFSWTDSEGNGYQPPDWARHGAGQTEIVEVPFRPLNSWSYSEKAALMFAGGEGFQGRGNIVRDTIAAADILSFAQTGNGSLSEQEFVVLGGERRVRIEQFGEGWDDDEEDSLAASAVVDRTVDTRNEDWLRTMAWDLGDPRAWAPLRDPAALLRLPVAESMPPEVRRTLELPPLTAAFNEDQERDEHGRWTGDGSSGAGPAVVLREPGQKLTKPMVVSRANKISKDVADFYGSDKVARVEVDEHGVLGDNAIAGVRDLDLTGRGPDEVILIEPHSVDRLKEADDGIWRFRIIAHEAVHASVSGTKYVLPGISKTVEEGAAEILSINYWDQRGQPMGPDDAVRREDRAEGQSRWTEPGKETLAAATVYQDEVREVLTRAASAVGWERGPVMGEVHRVMSGEHMDRIDFRDATDPTFPPPDGVDDDAESLIRWLIDQDVLTASVAFEFNPDQERDERGRWVGDGEGTARHGPARQATDAMVKALEEPDGGFTIDPRNGDTPITGYAVAYRGMSSITKADEFFTDRERAADIIEQHLIDNADFYDANPDAHVGGWHDPTHGEIVLDPARVIEDRDEAIRLGIEQNQQAIADLAAIHRGDWDNAFINTGGTGDRDELALIWSSYNRARSHHGGRDAEDATRSSETTEEGRGHDSRGTTRVRTQHRRRHVRNPQRNRAQVVTSATTDKDALGALTPLSRQFVLEQLAFVPDDVAELLVSAGVQIAAADEIVVNDEPWGAFYDSDLSTVFVADLAFDWDRSKAEAAMAQAPVMLHELGHAFDHVLGWPSLEPVFEIVWDEALDGHERAGNYYAESFYGLSTPQIELFAEAAAHTWFGTQPRDFTLTPTLRRVINELEPDPDRTLAEPPPAVVTRVARFAFDEDEHPRDENGRWTSGGGALVDAADYIDTSRNAHIRESLAESEGLDDRYWERADAHVADVIGRQALLIRASAGTVPEIVADGEFQNQFETGTSGGWIGEGSGRRRDLEVELFGIDPSAGPDARPIYGYLSDWDSYNLMTDTDGADHYGSFVFQVKNDVRERATWTSSDTLMDDRSGMTVGDVGNPSADGLLMDDDVDPLGWQGDGRPYIEAQIHGGLALADIEAVYYEGHLVSELVDSIAEADKNPDPKPLTPAEDAHGTLRALGALEQAKIPWYVSDEDGKWHSGSLDELRRVPA